MGGEPVLPLHHVPQRPPAHARLCRHLRTAATPPAPPRCAALSDHQDTCTRALHPA
ncbi:hypothetical protein HYPSUDRAFT_49581 [Hypholoma sublateritium FD-334 SS-4]|uniref:Uncharacterized protein n=1 Tax=Hypholoma sublateritium (strain FD-334 SS-4) TaxID=945553 RepID=A0A0D2N3L6_HYPSF|nr:hypothetical protein HYPSUDRAFT_49581 [Hypholoma sublateritium FD-334 SS-4]